MIPFKIGNLSFSLPTSHEQLTLKQFLQIRSLKEGDSVDYLSILSGVEKEVLLNCKSSDVDYLISLISFLSEDFDYVFPLPSKVNVGSERVSKLVPLPTIIESTYGQKVFFENLYREAINKAAAEEKTDLDLFDYYPKVLAIYFYMPMFGKTEFSNDWTKAIEKVLEWRIDIALPVAAFFLRTWKEYLLSNQKHLPTIQNQKKSTQVFKTLKSLVSSIRSTTLRMVILRSLTKYYRSNIAQYLRS